MLANPRSLPTKRCFQTTRLLVLPLFVFFLLGLLVHTSYPNYLNARDAEACVPKNNVVFLKTHKCASSSLQNIFFRYGDAHGLKFVLPKFGTYLGHPRPFNRTMLAHPHLPDYNMLVHHSRLNYREMKDLMPKDSVFVTIVRNPVEVFESSFSYYNLGSAVRVGGGEELKGDIHQYLKKVPSTTTDVLHRRIVGLYGTNQMMFDLGADPAIFPNDALVRQYVDRLDGWFDLVLVADRMDESLVLLRHLMCWGVDQVVTFKLNARAGQFVSNLTEVERSRLRQVNRADVLLYEHFRRRLDSEVQAFGRARMREEVEVLRERSRSWYDLCVIGEERDRRSKEYPKILANKKVMVLKTDVKKNRTCGLMTKKTFLYTDELRKRQVAYARAMVAKKEKDKTVGESSGSVENNR